MSHCMFADCCMLRLRRRVWGAKALLFVRQGYLHLQVTHAYLRSSRELRHQEEIWDATKGNATYTEIIKRSKKEVSAPPSTFEELRTKDEFSHL